MSNEKKKLDAKDIDQVAGGSTPFWKKMVEDANVNGTAHYIDDICYCCGNCVKACPVGAIHMGDYQYVIGPACIGCGVCASYCPVGAICSSR